MRKFLLFISLTLSCGYISAQFTDTFADGNFTGNPAWTGDASLYKVNTAFQLQLNASGEGSAALSSANALFQDMEWDFWIKLAFAPSDNNLAQVYLSSDQADLKSSLNGYYLKFGETGANDAIELVKQSGNIHTVICRGTDGLLAAAFAIRVKVIRSAGGIWKVYADPVGGVNYQLQASGTDNTFTSGSYLGVFSKFTSSNSTKFYYDDFYAGPVIIDNTPPQVLSVSLVSADQLLVSFSEAVAATGAVNLNNYTANPGSLNPVSATQDIADPSLVYLSFPQDFTPDVAYSLAIANVKDMAGNMMLPTQIPFSWHRAATFDVLINEIMADPTPPVNLPDAEYVELFNRSAFPVDLKNWVLKLGSSDKVLPQFTLSAGGYVILCDDGSKPLLASFGQVIDFSSFAVTNTDGTIVLQNPEGNMIHSVSYTDDWYRSSYKKEGGWSLELIDASNPCGETANWIAANNNDGGTPGKVNSVNAPNPDLLPPAIIRVGVNDSTHITVWFSESCDSTDISDPTNYSVDNGIGNPLAVLGQSPSYRIAYLTLASPLITGVVYTLTSNTSIKDCAGNTLLAGTSASFAIPSVAEANDIIINEVLFDPETGCVDFVEIYNRSAKVVDLKDLILANYDTINQVVTTYCEISSQSLLLLPEAYFVLTTDSSAVKKCYKTTNPSAFINMGNFPTMNNDFGLVALTSKGGQVIDLVAYTAEMQYPLLTTVDGVSLERISPERSSDDKTNWHSASGLAGYATPAYQNSQFGNTISDVNEISLSPAIFSPDNDGYNDNLTIIYTFGSPGNSLTISIYDAYGRVVRKLVNNELCGTSGAFSWDGITDDRVKAPIGRYIVFVEIFDLKGNVKRYKRSAVLGGRI